MFPEQHLGSEKITFTLTVSLSRIESPYLANRDYTQHHLQGMMGSSCFFYTCQHEHLDALELALALWSHIWDGVAVVYTLGFCKRPTDCFCFNTWNFLST